MVIVRLSDSGRREFRLILRSERRRKRFGGLARDDCHLSRSVRSKIQQSQQASGDSAIMIRYGCRLNVERHPSHGREVLQIIEVLI